MYRNFFRRFLVLMDIVESRRNSKVTIVTCSECGQAFLNTCSVCGLCWICHRQATDTDLCGSPVLQMKGPG